MNTTVTKYKEQLLGLWNKWSKTQKITIISITLATVVALILFTLQFSKTEYSNAFTDLNAEDAAAIKDYLQSAGVSYKLSTDGRTIGVPTTEVAEIKLSVESQGLMQNGSLGYGIFKENMSSFGMTDNTFNILSVDARAGEIQQLINRISGISSSKVVVNLPEESIFLSSEEKDQPTASVVISRKMGYTLDQAKIDTIYNLVSKSIPNLTLDNIMISDEGGELLPSSKKNEGLGDSATLIEQQMKVQTQFQEGIQKNVHDLLGRVLGEDKVVVNATAAINFDKKKTVENLVTPVNTVDMRGIELSIQEIQKSYRGDSTDLEGVAGTGETDVPGYPTTTGQGVVESEDVERTVNYEVNRITNEIAASPYTVKDLTINVGVEPLEGETDLPEATRNGIQQIVVNVVRASLADSGQTLTEEELQQRVVVLAHTFAPRNITELTKPTNYTLYAVIGGAVLLILAAIFFMLNRRKKTQDTETEEYQPITVAAATEQLEYKAKENEVRKQLEHMAKRKPDEFVTLLRSWLIDE